MSNVGHMSGSARPTKLMRAIKELVRAAPAEQMRATLERLLAEKATPDAFVDALPELRRLRDVLPRTRSELYTVIAIIIAILGLIQSQAQKLNEQDVERLIRDELEKHDMLDAGSHEGADANDE